MRVVHLSTSDIGGAATAAINLHLALLDRGVDSDLLTLGRNRNDIPRHTRIRPFELGGASWSNKLLYKLRRSLEWIGLAEDRNNQPKNRYLQGRPHDLEIFSLPYSWFSILDHPLVQKADVVHLHWVGFGLMDHRDFFSKCRSKVLWTMHDMNPFTGGCHHADLCTGYTKACEVCPQLRDLDRASVYWRYKKEALATFPKEKLQLVSPSQWLADHARASSLMSQRPCSVIPNGLDRSIFRPMDRMEARRALGLPLDQRIILFNAFDVTNPRKGMQLLLPALERLPKEVMLVCLGNSKGVVASGRSVREAGFIDSPDLIASYFAAADLFVLPSLAENLPNTISESLLCGTPVVAFRTGGIPEQVDASNGILIEKRSSEEFAEGIAKALERNWDHDRIATAAGERYDRTRIASAYMELYAN